MQCEECHMWFDEDNPKNKRQHQVYHDKVVNEFPYVKYKSEQRIFEEENLFITVIDRNSNHFEVTRAITVGIMGYTEFGYDRRPFDGSELCNPITQVKVFLAHIKSRTIGILVIEQATLKWKMTWQEYNNSMTPDGVPEDSTFWSDRFIWVHKKYRRRGIGRKLVLAALDYIEIHIDEFGYSSHLSDLGVHFAQSISLIFLGTRRY